MSPEAFGLIEAGVGAVATLLAAALVARRLKAIQSALGQLSVVGGTVEHALNNLNARLMVTALRRTEP